MTAIGVPGRTAAFVRPTFAHQNSAPMFVGQMVSPPHLNTASSAVTSTTSSAAASLYDKPPASPMDTSDNNISSHTISSTVSGNTHIHIPDNTRISCEKSKLIPKIESLIV